MLLNKEMAAVIASLTNPVGTVVSNLLMYICLIITP